MTAYLILAGLVGLYALAAAKLDRVWVTGPITFLAAGFVVGIWGADFLDLGISSETTRVVTGITLALLLFSDASRLGLRSLREDTSVISLLLFVALPLAVTLGTVSAWLLLPTLGVGMSALLASILAPTDLSLGLAMFRNPRVPDRVRRALNVESGLNDGIATAFVTLFLGVALAEMSEERHAFALAIAEMGIGVGIGFAVGVVGGILTRMSIRFKWSNPPARQFAAVAFALLAYGAALAIDGNGFVSAFVGGISFGAAHRHTAADSVDYTEKTGTLMSLAVWFVFGAGIAPLLISDGLHWRPIVYALASLTIIRVVSVVLPLKARKMHWSSVLFIGWFGPRGLASVAFLILAVQELREAGVATSLLTVTAGWAIILSVILHGVSAAPVAAWYGSKARDFAPGSPELEPATLAKTRHSKHLADSEPTRLR